jgi:hypothetical protein
MWVRFDQLASNNNDYYHVNNVQASGLLADHTTTATYTYGTRLPRFGGQVEHYFLSLRARV